MHKAIESGEIDEIMSRNHSTGYFSVNEPSLTGSVSDVDKKELLGNSVEHYSNKGLLNTFET